MNSIHLVFRSFACRAIAGLLLNGLLAGCGGDQPSPEQKAVTLPAQLPQASDAAVSVKELKRQLGANDNAEFIKASGKIVRVNLFNAGVTDITPLKGLPLRELDLGFVPVSDLSVLVDMPLESLILEGTQVTDLSALEGKSLEVLKVQDTPVSDLSPLADMPLRELNLKGTQVSSVEICKSMPLSTLWIPETQVTDLTPLAGKSLESLDIAGTKVSSLLPIADMTSLKRLNLVRSDVTDLSVLKGLALERLLFTPHRIESGIEVIRSMPSLQTLGTSFEEAMPAATFWEAYDAGKFQPVSD